MSLTSEARKEYKVKLTEEQARDLYKEGQDAEGNMHVISDEEWSGGGKYQSKSIYFTCGDKTYRLNISRCGSYFTEYSYEYELDCDEVVQKQRTIVENYWETVK